MDLALIKTIMFLVYQDAETLEVESKRFEDLEFQQLERESRQDEEKESQTQHILREIAEYQRSTVTRKVSFFNVCSRVSSKKMYLVRKSSWKILLGDAQYHNISKTISVLCLTDKWLFF